VTPPTYTIFVPHRLTSGPVANLPVVGLFEPTQATDDSGRSVFRGRRGCYPLGRRYGDVYHSLEIRTRGELVRAVRQSHEFTVYTEHGHVDGPAGAWLVQFADGSAGAFGDPTFHELFQRPAAICAACGGPIPS
jgi:hypothetical protein